MAVDEIMQHGHNVGKKALILKGHDKIVQKLKQFAFLLFEQKETDFPISLRCYRQLQRETSSTL